MPNLTNVGILFTRRVVLAALCLYLLSLSIPWTLAYLDLQVIRQLLRSSLGSGTSTQTLINHIDHAAAHQPLNADIYATLALVTSRPTPATATDPTSAAQNDAGTALHKALTLRPGNGHLWAQYAVALFAQEGLSPRVRYALDRAWTLAPYQQPVIARIFWVYLGASSNNASLTQEERTRFSAASNWMRDKVSRQLKTMLPTPDLTDEVLTLAITDATRDWLTAHKTALLNP